MSRTYRKNIRHYEKFRGEFYNTYKDRTVKGKARNYSDDSDWGASVIWGAGYFRQEVLVGDSENYGSSAPKGYKAMHNRIDRARYAQALIKNGDAVIKTSFDPWDWD